MSYSSEIYQRAINILQKRRDKSLLEVQNNELKAKAVIPELTNIDDELAQIGLSVSMSLFKGTDSKAEIEKLHVKSKALQEKKKKLLTENGFPEDLFEQKYVCPICKDAGFVNDKMCICHKELLKELERQEVKKFAPLDDCTFDTFNTDLYPDSDDEMSPRKKMEQIKESCRLYAQSFTTKSPSLMFMGGTGLGKTHLSLAIANVAINKGYSVIYGSSQNIVSDLQNENFGRTDDLSYTEKEVLGTNLLIIDDLGTEYKSQYSVACLYNIINTRILRKLPTIISTNFEYEDLERDYNQRITSRISGVYSNLVFEGNDIRNIL